MGERKKPLPADKLYATKLKDPVRIRPVELNTTPPRSVPRVFDQVCRQYPTRAALHTKRNDCWDSITYKEYRAMVRCCAKGFIHLGLLPNTVVCILGFNSVEWFVADLAAIYAGGVASGIYTTNSPEACLYCLNHCQARIIVVENVQAFKILEIRDRAKSLQAVVQYGGGMVPPNVITWEKLMRMGEAVPDSLLDKMTRDVNVNQCCTLVYTSGTTGNPKGVMLSHDNIVYDASKIGEKLQLTRSPTEVYVSYLPLSHVAGNLVDIHCTYLYAVEVYFADKDALKGSLLTTFQEVRPTRILSVPRVWEKIYEKMQEKAENTTVMKKLISSWATRQGLKKNMAMEKNEPHSYMYYFANFLMFRKIRRILGVDNCKTIISGAAPLSSDVKLYFAGFDILICEGFGMSECAALHCCCVPQSFRFDSCGTPCSGMVTDIENPDEEGNGELLLYGRHVFMGYLNDEAKTAETLDKRGYLHTGDIARIDDTGFVYITGRIKELIITAGGENVAPVILEQNIKTALPFIGHAVVIGDRKKFLIVLLTLPTEVNSNQKPTDVLLPRVRTWLTELGFNFTTTSEVLNSGPHRKILDSIQAGLDAANAKAISNAQKVQKFVLLPCDFSMATGELGPTMKIKRSVVSDKYSDIIDRIYQAAIVSGQ